MKDKPKYSIVIPVFNEAENIQELHTRLNDVMGTLQEPYEVIYIDDGSTDSSMQIIRQICHSEDHVRSIQFTRNFGQIPAVMAGCDIAMGDIVITLDADLQNPPEEIPKLIDKINEGYEVVFGVFPQRKHNTFRRAGSWFAKWVLSHTISVDRTDISGFRAMKSCVVDQLRPFKEKSIFLSGLLCWMGYKVGTIEVNHDARYFGKEKYGPLKLLGRWLDMVISFTELPLKIATLGGMILGMAGFALALFYLIRYLLHGSSVPGFATIVILITCFSGIQLFSVGVIGEYIGRMNREVKNRPNYIIREKIN
jgi:glycosyltransferase involved in cell wall biosynthesis